MERLGVYRHFQKRKKYCLICVRKLGLSCVIGPNPHCWAVAVRKLHMKEPARSFPPKSFVPVNYALHLARTLSWRAAGVRGGAGSQEERCAGHFLSKYFCTSIGFHYLVYDFYITVFVISVCMDYFGFTANVFMLYGPPHLKFFSSSATGCNL